MQEELVFKVVTSKLCLERNGIEWNMAIALLFIRNRVCS